MKTLTVELFNPARPEHGQYVTLTITHNGHTPDKAGEVYIYVQCNRKCEYTAYMIISGCEDSAACYAITADKAIANDTFQDLVVSLQNRIVELFGGCGQ